MTSKSRFSRAGVKLGAAVLCLGLAAIWLVPAHGVQAATVSVGCDVNALIAAIKTANINAGADTLDLATSCTYTLTAADNTDATLGPNGLPVITSDITLNGNGSMIARDSAAPAFRFFEVKSGAILTLNQLTLTGGMTPDGENGDKGNPGGDGKSGAAIYNDGICHINNTVIRGNRTGAGGKSYQNGGDGGYGAGIFNAGTLTLTNCRLEENQTGMGGEAGNNGDSGQGGAIYNAAGGTVNVSSCQLLNNRTADGSSGGGTGSTGNGGAFANEGTATVTNTTFSGNATGNGGTALFGRNGGDGGAIYNRGTLNINTSTIRNNSAGVGGPATSQMDNGGNGGDGGGIYTTGDAVLNETILYGNSAGQGGNGYSGEVSGSSGGNGGHGGAVYNSGSLTIGYTSLDANRAGSGGQSGSTTGGAAASGGLGGAGGAIYNSGTLNLASSTVANNFAGSGGGGLYGGDGGDGGGVESIGTLNITMTVMSKNLAGGGGPASCLVCGGSGGGGGGIDNSGSASVVNSTFDQNAAGNGYSPNSSSGNGGGILHRNDTLRAVNLTLSGNRVGLGGLSPAVGAALASTGGSIALANTIVANNGTEDSCSGTITDNGGNLRWPASASSCIGIYGDPKLGGLADNGGPTQTMALPLDSAAIDHGIDASCPLTDQRGVSRPQGTHCDAGSYELELTIVQEMDESVRYDGWRAVNAAQASGGTSRMSNAKDDSVTFKFTGRSVSWLTKKGPAQGKARVTIDGVNKGTFDLYAPTEKYKIVEKFGGLPNTKHTLLLNVLGAKNNAASGNYVLVDGFVVGSSTIEETSPRVHYNMWRGVVNGNASSGTLRSNARAGAEARFIFSGTGVMWLTAKGPTYGQAKVVIDGVNKGTFDLYAAKQRWQVLIPFPGLKNGKHTLVVQVLGSKNKKSSGTTVVVDAFLGQVVAADK